MFGRRPSQIFEQHIDNIQTRFNREHHVFLKNAGEAQERMAAWRIDRGAGLVLHESADIVDLNAEQVTKEAKMIEDLGADSLDAVELVMAIEEEFGIEVPDDEAEKLASVGDIVTYVDKVSE